MERIDNEKKYNYFTYYVGRYDFFREEEIFGDLDLLYWNKNIKENPDQLDYWLDFIQVPGYSIESIGKRTKVSKKEKLNTLWNAPIPDLYFYGQDEEAPSFENEGTVFKLNNLYNNYFVSSSSQGSLLDEIRTLIQNHLVYNAQINLTTLPQYHLEPNNLIYINDSYSGINGTYLMTSITIPLSYNGTMQIVASEIVIKY